MFVLNWNTRVTRTKGRKPDHEHTCQIMSILFGPIRQMGYVVRDIEAAMQHWTQALRIGPFYYAKGAPIHELSYRGAASDVQASIALSYSGNMQIALIQQRNEAPSSFLDFLNAGRNGLHHVGFFSSNFDRDLHRAREAGLDVLQTSIIGSPEGKFAILGSEDPVRTRPALIAISDSNLDLFRMVEKEALRWDGSGPIRRFANSKSLNAVA
jgi:hypothetical protein